MWYSNHLRIYLCFQILVEYKFLLEVTEDFRVLVVGIVKLVDIGCFDYQKEVASKICLVLNKHRLAMEL